MKAEPRSQEYVERLLREYPPTTRGGMHYRLIDKGQRVQTIKRDGTDGGYYLPTDYPLLFGWKRPKIKKPPLVIDFRGYRYVRMKRQK